jgi:hypothetical protein
MLRPFLLYALYFVTVLFSVWVEPVVRGWLLYTDVL